MPLNTPLLLAPLALEMEQMAELLAAEQPELDAVVEHARQVTLECSVNTCTETIARYERIFAQPAGGKSLADRRAAILFLLNARLQVTKEYMERLLGEVLGCRVWMEEFYSEYRFRMNVEGENRTPDMAEAARKLRLLKPAHLEATLRYRQVERGKVRVGARAGIGLFLQVQPYQPENVASSGCIHSILYIKGAQRLQIQPKGD